MRKALKISCVALALAFVGLSFTGGADAAVRRSYRGYTYNPNAPVTPGYQESFVVFAPFPVSLGPIPGYARADHKMLGKFGGK